MHIRPATDNDRSAILALMRPGDYNRINLDPACFLVATTSPDGKETAEIGELPVVVGIGQVKRHWDGTLELASLVVDHAYRRRGIGSAIVRALVARHFALSGEPAITRKGCMAVAPEPLYLFCLSTLETYYRQFGFCRVERQQLPWPLTIMHILGNGVGRLARFFDGPEFYVVAMNITDSCYKLRNNVSATDHRNFGK